MKRTVCLSLLAAATFLASCSRSPYNAAATTPSQQPAQAPVHSGDLGFAAILKPALPAVVSITTSRVVNVPQSPLLQNPFFQQFFGGALPRGPMHQREHALGSGVIVRPDGYILTNNHVIEHAAEIRVFLPDKREFTGKVVGSDPKTDIAVVKIAATGLPAMKFGDSSQLQVGDYAFAIGNPFDIGETATMGIISATGRNGLDIEDYEDFIQTDASINPGNSGGALLNARGELIGINTAILSGNSGGNQGIGFAIPINLAKYVMDQIVAHGKVVRGYIGVGVQNLTPDLAKAFHASAPQGALVGSVEPNSPGAKAGLERGDIITQINGQPINSANDLFLKVGTLPPGASVHLTVSHNGQTRQVTLTLGEAPSGGAAGAAAANAAETGAMRGVQVDNLTPATRQHLGLPANAHGVVITDVADGSPAADVGLQLGDVIQEIDQQPVNSVADYRRLVVAAGSGNVVLLLDRGGNTAFVVIPGG